MDALKILYIDDSTTELEFVSRTLTPAGYEVTTTTGIQDAQVVVAQADLVLVDYYMPGLDGAQATKRLRKMCPDAGGPMFYLYTNDSDVGKDYRSLGFDGRLILKGNAEALVKQVGAATRVIRLRKLRPTA